MALDPRWEQNFYVWTFIFFIFRTVDFIFPNFKLFLSKTDKNRDFRIISKIFLDSRILNNNVNNQNWKIIKCF